MPVSTFPRRDQTARCFRLSWTEPQLHAAFKQLVFTNSYRRLVARVLVANRAKAVVRIRVQLPGSSVNVSRRSTVPTGVYCDVGSLFLIDSSLAYSVQGLKDTMTLARAKLLDYASWVAQRL